MTLFIVAQSPPITSMNCLAKSKLFLHLQIAVMRHCNFKSISFDENFLETDSSFQQKVNMLPALNWKVYVSCQTSVPRETHPFSSESTLHLEMVSIARKELRSGILWSEKHIHQSAIKCLFSMEKMLVLDLMQPYKCEKPC